MLGRWTPSPASPDECQESWMDALRDNQLGKTAITVICKPATRSQHPAACTATRINQACRSGPRRLRGTPDLLTTQMARENLRRRGRRGPYNEAATSRQPCPQTPRARARPGLTERAMTDIALNGWRCGSVRRHVARPRRHTSSVTGGRIACLQAAVEHRGTDHLPDLPRTVDPGGVSQFYPERLAVGIPRIFEYSARSCRICNGTSFWKAAPRSGRAVPGSLTFWLYRFLEIYRTLVCGRRS